MDKLSKHELTQIAQHLADYLETSDIAFEERAPIMYLSCRCLDVAEQEVKNEH